MLWILLFIFLGVFTYILFSRLLIEIDSTLNLYRVRYGRLMAGDVVFVNNKVQLMLTFILWKKIIDLKINNEPAEKKERIYVGNNKTTKDLSGTKIASKILHVLRSFKVTKCLISIDTGNMPLNGILFPYFYLISVRTKKCIKINFWGENKIILQIENSLARMLWAFVKS